MFLALSPFIDVQKYIFLCLFHSLFVDDCLQGAEDLFWIIKSDILVLFAHLF